MGKREKKRKDKRIPLEHDLSPNDHRWVQTIGERVSYGVGVTDTWSLDYYFVGVMANGLEQFSDVTCGYPGNYDSYDDWVKDVRKHAKALRWAYRHWFKRRLKAPRVAAKSMHWVAENLTRFWW